jgi:NodT family efflux transporter outer membrane factor (OMF) lipoprotein
LRGIKQRERASKKSNASGEKINPSTEQLSDMRSRERVSRSRLLTRSRAHGQLKLRERTTVLLAMMGLVAGCTVGPNFTRPAAPRSGYSAPAQIGAQRLSVGQDVPANWYTLFGSERLNTLVEQALRANPDLDAARHSLAAAQYELHAVAGTALPQIALGAHVMRARVNGSFLYEPDEAFQATANQYNFGPTLVYDLDVFGRIRRTVEAQSAQTDEVHHQTLNVYITLVSQVVLTAFNIAASGAQIEATRHLVNDLQAQYELTRTLENAGKVPRTDTLLARTQLETTRSTLPGLEKQQAVYRNALLRLIGSAPDDPAAPELALRDFVLPRELPVSLPSQLVRRRPDILEAEDALHRASAQIGVAEAARFPSFILSAQYAQQSGSTSDLLSKAAQIWSVGLNVSQPIFQGGTLRARQKEAEQIYLQTQAQYRGAVIDALVEVVDALQALQYDTATDAARGTALEAAAANRDLAHLQFAQGRVSELIVLTAEQQYQNGVLALVQADAQRFADAATLIHALGGGWWNAHDPTALPIAATDDATTHSNVDSTQ